MAPAIRELFQSLSDRIYGRRRESGEEVGTPSAGPEDTSPEVLHLVVDREDRQFVVPVAGIHQFAFANGDRITIAPPERAASLHRTPDGSRHVAYLDQRFRIPEIYTLSPHKGYLFPEHLVVLTGAGTETLDLFGKLHIDSYRQHMGLTEGMSVVELGCGIGRDALQLISLLGPSGRYMGVDVTWDSIDWCQKNITTKHPNFQFRHFDAQHELYNPLGTKTSLDFRFPVADRSVDRLFAGSVFTHLFEEEIVHYMREIARVLKPDGLAYTTFFLYSDETISSARRTNLTHNNLMFHHPYADGCYVNDAAYPTGAVAFTSEAMERMIGSAGVRLDRPFLGGGWSGFYKDASDGQEVAILGA